MKFATILLTLFLSASLVRTIPERQEPSQSVDPPERSTKLTGAISGRVVGPDGQPISNADVVAIRMNIRNNNWGSTKATICDEEGRFLVSGLSPGPYLLFAQAPGYVSADLPLENAIHRI